MKLYRPYCETTYPMIDKWIIDSKKNPILKVACLLLCRNFFNAIKEPDAPPNIETVHKLFSLILYCPFLAFSLSAYIRQKPITFIAIQ